MMTLAVGYPPPESLFPFVLPKFLSVWPFSTHVLHSLPTYSSFISFHFFQSFVVHPFFLKLSFPLYVPLLLLSNSWEKGQQPCSPPFLCEFRLPFLLPKE